VRDAEFDARHERLLESMAELVDALRVVSEDRWADWIERDRGRIAKFDRYGLDHLLQAYGGMGSLNDLVIHPMNGHQVAETELASVNDRLRSLVGRTYGDASALRRELDRPNQPTLEA
jgi:hypothetical protein